jgi:hypothetical protein
MMPLDDYATYRIANISSKRHLSSYEQFVTKVSECGKPSVEPDRLYKRLIELVLAGFLSTEIGPGGKHFYFPTAIKANTLHARRAALYPVMENWEKDGANTSQLLWLVKEDLAKHLQVSHYDDQSLLLSTDTKQICLWAVNSRQWFTLSDAQGFIADCITNGYQPAIICRRASPCSLLALRKASVPILQTYAQYFPPMIEVMLAPVRHKDLGGIKDIVCTDRLETRISKFINKTIWRSNPQHLTLEQLMACESASGWLQQQVA